jgi:rubrerythrin
MTDDEANEDYLRKFLNKPIGAYWMCVECGQWKKAMPADHNGSGPICGTCCEKKVTR